MKLKFGLLLLTSLIMPQLASATSSGKVMCGLESRVRSDNSVGSTSGSDGGCSVQFTAEAAPAVSRSNDHYFEKELMKCELASTGRPVAIKYWKNFGYEHSISNNEGIHLGTTDNAEPYIGLAITEDLGDLHWALTPEKFYVKHWDFLMIGTSMRASIEVNQRSGEGSLSYRSKICQWDRCFEHRLRDRLKNCTPTIDLE